MSQQDTFSAPALEQALERCRSAARSAYEKARHDLEESAPVLDRVSGELSLFLNEEKGESVYLEDIVREIGRQYAAVRDALEELHTTSRIALDERFRNLDKFSLILFGRTLAGKSTLMEILTHGNGASIGKGAQRTTRSVRRYEWKGLEVTDVPGVAAFEGQEDEDMAFKAAEKADLVLFLITDDAPQPAEARCLEKLLRMGKRVLGICNVKAALDNEEDRLLFLHRPEKYFSESRLHELTEQFGHFVEKNWSGEKIIFEATHLRARFLADQPDFASCREGLLAASRFDRVERRIADEVITRGIFLRIKNFFDAAGAPVLADMEKLLDDSLRNRKSCAVIRRKKEQIRSWIARFREDALHSIDNCVADLVVAMYNEVPSFAEEHYADAEAGKKWQNFLNTLPVEENLQRCQQELTDISRAALSTRARELRTELSINLKLLGAARIHMGEIVDAKRIWDWGTCLVSGGLGVVALFASGPLGWTAAGLGIVGSVVSNMFFDTRERKIARARRELGHKLMTNIKSIDRELMTHMKGWLQRLLRQLELLPRELDLAEERVRKLAESQYRLAAALNEEQKKTGLRLILEALDFIGASSWRGAVADVARVPGEALLIRLHRQCPLPPDKVAALSELLGEKIWLVEEESPAAMFRSLGLEVGMEEKEAEHSLILSPPLASLGAEMRLKARLIRQLGACAVI